MLHLAKTPLFVWRLEMPYSPWAAMGWPASHPQFQAGQRGMVRVRVMFALYLCPASVTDQLCNLNPSSLFPTSVTLDKSITPLRLLPLLHNEEITCTSRAYIRASRHPGNYQDQWYSNFSPLNEWEMISE